MAISYAAFADAPVDVAVVEAHRHDDGDLGVDHVGGIPGAAEADLDHTDYLGDTLAEIAGEKARC